MRAVAGGDEQDTAIGLAFDEATGHGDESGRKRAPRTDLSREDVVVLGSSC